MKDMHDIVNTFLERTLDLEFDEFIEELNYKIETFDMEKTIFFLKISINKLGNKRKKLEYIKRNMKSEFDKINTRKNIKEIKKKINFLNNNLGKLLKEEKQYIKNQHQHIKTKQVTKCIEQKKVIKTKRKNHAHKNKERKYNVIKTFSNQSVTTTSKNNDNNFYLPFSLSQIMEIDERFNINTEKLIEELNATEYKDNKINEIISIYNNVLEKLKMTNNNDDIKIVKSILKDLEIFRNSRMNLSLSNVKLIDQKFDINVLDIINELNNFYGFQEKIDNIILIYNDVLEKLNNSNNNKDINTINYLLEKLNIYSKKILKNCNEKCGKELIYDEAIELNDIQRSIKNLISQNGIINGYNVKDFIVAFTYFIKTCNVLDNKDKILNYTDYLNNDLSEYMFRNKNITDEFLFMLDVINNEISRYNKDGMERKILKEVQNTIKPYYYIYKNKQSSKEESNPYFELIDYWLKDEYNYLYLKELIKRIPECVNAHSNGIHIIIHLLEQYILNMKKMIQDKNCDYVSSKYLKEVYLLFTKDYKLNLTKDEIKTINKMIYEFSFYIRQTLIKEKRRNRALLDIKDFSPDLYYIPRDEVILYDISDDNICYDKQRIANNYKTLIKNKYDKEAFIVGFNRAYSIEETDESTILNLYSMDLHQVIMRESIMNKYFENLEMTREDVDPFVFKEFLFKENNIYLTINYQLEFFKSGKLKDLKLNRCFVKINEHINNFDLENQNMFVLNELYKKSVNKNGGFLSTFNLATLNDHFENLLNNEFIKFVKNKKLPLIYYGYSNPDEETINKNSNDLANILHKLEKGKSREIIDIYSHKLDEPHYSIMPIPNATYKLNLLDSFNYLGIEHQRMLGDLYFNLRGYEANERIVKERTKYLYNYIDKVNELNSTFDYVDQYEIKASKGQIKRKVRL